jgi:hypothetical protein
VNAVTSRHVGPFLVRDLHLLVDHANREEQP